MSGFFSKEITIHDEIVESIKESLITDGVFKDQDFVLDDFMPNDKYHMAVFVLVDVSGSIEKFLNDVNSAVESFVDSVIAPNSIARDCLEFCYITFNETVHVRKRLGFLSAHEEDPSWHRIDPSEVAGRTDIASALFYAWYMGEKRKEYYKSKDMKNYFQPIIVLVSDLGHNFNHNIRELETSLMDYMLQLIAAKRNAKKLGMLEIATSKPSDHCHEKIVKNAQALYDLPVDKTTTKAPEQFVECFNSILHNCYATVVNPGRTGIIHADEDESGVIESTDIFINSQETKKGLFGKKKLFK